MFRRRTLLQWENILHKRHEDSRSNARWQTEVSAHFVSGRNADIFLIDIGEGLVCR
jgi:hypothetical protein